MRTMKTLALAAIAASALALAGCGGGGSNTTSLTPPAGDDPPPKAGTPAPTPTPAAVTLPSEDNKYLADADTMLEDGTVSLAAGASTTLGAYMLSCSAAGPCEVTIADGKVEATGEVTAAYTAAAQKTIDDAKKVAAAENKDRATGLSSALADAKGAAGATGRGEPIRVDAAGLKNGDFEISRGLSGMAEVSDGGKSGWSTRSAPNALAGWQGTVLDNGKTQTYTVYTDIAPAKRKAFLTYYKPAAADLGPTAPVKGLPSGVTIDFQSTPSATTHGVITFTAAADLAAAANAGLLDTNDFPQPKAPGAGTNTYEYFGTVGKKARTFTGTFHGASGTYACGTGGTVASNCAVTVTAPSTNRGPVYSATGSGWTFTPDLKNNPQIIEQDADHMHFGWWINTPKAAGVGGEFLYDVQVFSGGSDPFNDQTTIDTLQGDADYTGPAAGLFAVTENTASKVAAAYGEFTATATLTAKFGTSASGTPGSISGTIGSFVRSDGVANDWALKLGKADIASTGTPLDDGIGSGNIVDGNDQIGGWNFQLYGPGTNGANPTGIAGAFDAAIDKNTTVAGAFGAKPK